MKLRPGHSEKSHGVDGLKTVGEIAREERAAFDALPMVVRCAIGDCGWWFEGSAGEARAEAAGHRARVHGGRAWEGQPFMGFETNGGAEAGVEALARMDAGEPQRPLGEGEPSGGEPGLESGGPAADPGSAQQGILSGSSPSPSGRKKWTREAMLAAIRAFAEEHGRAPAVKEWDRRTDDGPGRNAIAYEFGSWNRAITAAGLTPRIRGQKIAPLSAGPRTTPPPPGADGTRDPAPSGDTQGTDEPQAEGDAAQPPGGASTPRPALLLILEGLRDLVDHYWPEPPGD